MEFKGTKGEWKAIRNASYWEVANRENNQSLAIAVHNFDYREHGVQLSDDKTAEANAKLIAASKDLLEALIELKRWVVDTHIASEALNNANKAIDKALN
jgi:hypothetical protein